MVLKFTIEILKTILPFISGWLDSWYQSARHKSQIKSFDKLRKVHQALDTINVETGAIGAVVILISNDGKCVDYTRPTYWQIIEESMHSKREWLIDGGFQKQQIDHSHKQAVREMIDSPTGKFAFITDKLQDSNPLRVVYLNRGVAKSVQYVLKIDDNVIYVSIHYETKKEYTDQENYIVQREIGTLRKCYGDQFIHEIPM